mmetsp:Transcript_62919/g.124381  ORF Transcript_62919/g.124381 Transcript_62919/m.124381 type:complete len:368 (+) Transcript_62919:80-1183(+)
MQVVQLAVFGFAMTQVVHAADANCTKAGEDCSLTGCCATEGHKCFRKNEHWSACNETCAPYRVWKDGKWQDSTEKTWDCEAVLPHQVARVPMCKDPKNDGEDCSATGCCSKKGSRCFKKNGHHSSCNATCTPNAKWDKDKWVTSTEAVWSCTVVKPVLAESAHEHKCNVPSENGLDCSVGGCCKDAGSTCYKKNDHWSSCNASCTPNMKWVDGAWAEQNETVWDCAVVYPPAIPKMDCDDPKDDGQDCRDTGCCKKTGSICFKKNDHWASCMDRCWTNKKWEGGKWVEKNYSLWDCGVIAPKKKSSRLRLYDISDAKQVAEEATSQKWPSSLPLLAALAFGLVAGGSIAAFRRPRSREVLQESDALE